VVLTVDPKNLPAVSAYERLGYEEKSQLVEASATRRDPSGLGCGLRRMRAAIRGRRYGGSYVTVEA
jgi:ribosomal protein S18 acetylase RimI-like enzyme